MAFIVSKRQSVCLILQWLYIKYPSLIEAATDLHMLSIVMKALISPPGGDRKGY